MKVIHCLRYCQKSQLASASLLGAVWLIGLLVLQSCTSQSIKLVPGLITGSEHFQPGVYVYEAPEGMDTSVITLSGEDIVIDFEGVVLQGARPDTPADSFQGIGIRILNGANITVRNLTVRGYKIALYAENVTHLTLENCDFSYNFRQRLASKWDRESLSDWLYYHDNENDEWFRYGAGAYLKQCVHATVCGLRVTQGQNGLMLVGCNNGLFYNNDIRFNSGLGIGMYRASSNRIMHNRLDWNVRGYSHGQYARGQDSAGILLYQQCDSNVIAYNSATHSGDGLFLWAGNYTMDTGLGGCNDNIICCNDFSHSVANGVEATFSSNIIVDNILNDSRYGVWAGYSHHSYIAGNEMDGCDFGIAIEHGNHNDIRENIISNCDVGIQLWERSSQPEGWGFAEKRDVSSRAYQIRDNAFAFVNTALEISGTDTLLIEGNTFNGVTDQLVSKSPNRFTGAAQLFPDAPTFEYPEPLPDGMDAMLPEGVLRGRQYMIVNDWGPYNFEYPLAVLRSVEDATRSFSLFGPSGNWEVRASNGFENINPVRGSMPAALAATQARDSAHMVLDLLFIGESFIDQFGDTIMKGQPYAFGYSAFSPTMEWVIAFYTYNERTSPLGANSIFDRIGQINPSGTMRSETLGYRWWREPMPGVPADRFATVATATLRCPPGRYLIETESDDGIRVYIDDALVIDHWDVHTPAIDYAEMELIGEHSVRILHFDNGGLAALDFSITPFAPPN